MSTTEKVLSLLKDGRVTKVYLAKRLGISRPTLDRRILGASPWKPLEVISIKNLYLRKT